MYPFLLVVSLARIIILILDYLVPRESIDICRDYNKRQASHCNNSNYKKKSFRKYFESTSKT